MTANASRPSPMRRAPAELARVSAREWRTITIGVALVVGAWISTRWVVPQWQHYRDRAGEIARAERRVAELEGLIAHEAVLEARATAAERALTGAPVRVLHAASTPLGGNALQQYLTSAVEAAGLALDRIDLDPDATAASSDGTRHVAAQATVLGDIHGLAALLGALDGGPRRVAVTRLQIRQNSALRGAPDVLQIVFTVSAPLLLDGDSP